MSGVTTLKDLNIFSLYLRKALKFLNQYPFNPALFPSESVKEKSNAT